MVEKNKDYWENVHISYMVMIHPCHKLQQVHKHFFIQRSFDQYGKTFGKKKIMQLAQKLIK